MEYQRTLATPIEMNSITLHSGIPASMTIHPAPADSGILFRRADLSPVENISAVPHNVSSTDRCTQLTNEQHYSISMVEHVMSALRGMGVDNAIIEADGEEIPVFDGSSVMISDRIAETGLVEQHALKKYRRLTQAIRVQIGRSYLEAIPSEEISYEIQFTNDHEFPFLTNQIAYFNPAIHDYRSEISPARTFGFEQEVNLLRSKGLIQGASMDNAVLIGNSQILSDLRYPDEFARHKLLDVMGDLALAPPVLAQVRGVRTSHRLNTLLAREIMNNLH
ncbi:UDP-3-O-acyl-N-acetylglucosamine deacetylase [Paenibacillus urinalis]|uniref:UDP-3-O-acyl-N-acetylglucosamine deacetylase n=1 Tax=Paenibacillus urinalis TaxID=521520 RepID=A0AAX3N4L3_9BACL|nr:UDP-3-O-acyl-N-acetylglucosamine deacetylase [Paenibacillus urinalis]WDH83655.1 UDP-3-O-acyl-N-acetylglucosamine deacetylase [Paenibacillus urinalis]WDH99683.1 UDP-3-O-acyl-N-acetylglucosamine deacetylase [Paenibacillus urinalis]WDI03316.1 UDP-3-O-acyl-N-acetylglucosamine deacetylase [Paenibacillus urinalis]